MIKVSAIHEAALLIAIHVGVVVSTVTLELQTMQYPSDLYATKIFGSDDHHRILILGS